jgi:hypothetical protein
MLKPAGCIRRIAREPNIHLEHLANEWKPGEEPLWSDDETAAFIFPDYFDAEQAAKNLHKQIGGPMIFAFTQPQQTPADRERVFVNGELIEIPHRSRTHHFRRSHAITGSAPNAPEVFS